MKYKLPEKVPGQKWRDHLAKHKARLAGQKPDEPLSDTVLLNWMISKGARISWSRDLEVCSVWVPNHGGEGDEPSELPAEGYPQKVYYTGREAIEGAIKAERSS